MKHKHAEFFMAIANGESPYDWECQQSGSTRWTDVLVAGITHHPDDYKVRRKQKTHIVNGFTVPAPEKHAPCDDIQYYFVPSPAYDDFHNRLPWEDSFYDNKALWRGLVHLSKEAAIANAKAMLGIDPNSND